MTQVVCELRLLGIPAIWIGEREKRITNRNAVTLLALLSNELSRQVSRTQLCKIIWPNSPEEAARTSLRRLLSDLRTMLEGSTFEITTQGKEYVQLQSGSGEIDLVRWLSSDLPLTPIQREALDQLPPRLDRLRSGWSDLDADRQLRIAHSNPSEGSAAALRTLLPSVTTPQKILVGIIDLAVQNNCSEWLPPEVDIEHYAPDLRSNLQRARTEIAFSQTQETRLLGREEDSRHILNSLNQGPSLITVVGLGGIGKTPLVQEVLRERGLEFEAIYLNDASSNLSFKSDIEVKTQRHKSPIVLWIDAAEHLLKSDSESLHLISNLVKAGWRVLATSRFPLGIKGEHVHPLSMLDTETLHSAGQALFIREATRTLGRVLTADEQEVVSQICRAGQGHPGLLMRLASLTRYTSLAGILKSVKQERGVNLDPFVLQGLNHLSDSEKKSFLSALVFQDRFALSDFLLLSNNSIESFEKLVQVGLIQHFRNTSPPLFIVLDSIRESILVDSHWTHELNISRKEMAATFAETHFFADHEIWRSSSAELVERIIRLQNTVTNLLTQLPISERFDLLIKIHQVCWRANRLPQAIQMLRMILASIDAEIQDEVFTSHLSVQLTLEQSLNHVGQFNHFIELASSSMPGFVDRNEINMEFYIGHSYALALASQEQFPESHELLNQLSEKARSIGEKPMVAYQMRGLAQVNFWEGNLEQARRLALESAAIFEEFEIPVQALESFALATMIDIELGAKDSALTFKLIATRAQSYGNRELELEALIYHAWISEDRESLSAYEKEVLESHNLKLILLLFGKLSRLDPSDISSKLILLKKLSANTPLTYWRYIWTDIFGMKPGLFSAGVTERLVWRDRMIASLNSD